MRIYSSDSMRQLSLCSLTSSILFAKMFPSTMKQLPMPGKLFCFLKNSTDSDRFRRN